MHYTKHADNFFEALPIGNGRLGAMVFGHPTKDTLILNESTMWSGSVEESDNPQANGFLPMIREKLIMGDNYEAQELYKEHFVCNGLGTNFANAANEPFGCYQVLGTLRFNFFQATSFAHQSGESLEGYIRELDLEEAKATVSFGNFAGGFKREYISSYPDQVIVARFTSDQPGSISFSIALDREENYETTLLENQILQMTGQLAGGKDDGGIKYASHVRVDAKSGTVFINSGRLCVSGADEAIVYISAATNMQGFLGENISDEVGWSLNKVNAAYEKGWTRIENSHKEDFQALYKRNEIGFIKEEDYREIDLWQRIRNFSLESRDYGLIELYYNYARYLLISSSREDGLPCNLQGIWAGEIQTPWNGDWHLNAQQELYWLAEVGNLSECHVPYLRLTEFLVEPGKETAQAYYNASGWVAHTCTNPWGFTSPCEDAAWGSTTGSGAWQSHHLWDHYLYTCDRNYLEWAYPTMKEAALFYCVMLVEEPRNNWLVTCPSSSPENNFLDKKGREVALCMGPTYDNELVSSLFQYCIKASSILDVDLDFRNTLESKLKKLPPIQIASDGRIMEWLEEYDEALIHHRHLSHLWGVYPGYLISQEKTPELAEAALKSLMARGETTAGWANAYRLAVWAKLRKAERAYESIVMAFKASTSKNMMNLAYHCDETLLEPQMPDIDNNFYPFQMDGNEGHSAGIALMLVDDHVEVSDDGAMETIIYVAPAIPERLTDGFVRGMKLKGGFELSYSWNQGQVVEGTVINHCGQKAKIVFNDQIIADVKSHEKEISFTS